MKDIKNKLFPYLMLVRSYIKKLNFYIILLFLITLPYHINNGQIGTFAFTCFIFGIISYGRSILSIWKYNHMRFLIFFLIYICIGLFWSENIDVSIENFKYFPFIVIGIYLSDLTKKQIMFIFSAFCFSTIIYVLLNIYNSFGIPPFIYSSHYGNLAYYNPDQYILYKLLMFDLRISIFLVISLFFFLISFLDSLKNKSYRYFFVYLVLFILYIISLFVDKTFLSKMAIVSLVMGGLYLVYFYLLKNKKKYIFGIFSILFIMISLSSLMISKNLKQEIISTGNELYNVYKKEDYTTSLGYRIGMLETGYYMFLENPIFGKGVKNLENDINRTRNSHPKLSNTINRIKSFHNEHILLLVFLGVLGYTIFVLFIYFSFKLDIQDERTMLFKNLVVIIYIVYMFGEYYVTNKTNGNTFIALISLFTLYKAIEDKATNFSLNS